MTLIVAGTVRVPPQSLDGLRPHMTAMMTASRAEDGCAAYGYAEDVAEPGLIHVFEVWRDQAALEAHFKTQHMAAWRAAWPSFGVSDRRLFAYEVASERPL
jgi:quinol monooxygenase YgiN